MRPRFPRLLTIGLAAITIVATGCTGFTKEATRVTTTTARLNGQGTSGAEGSQWYYEYGPFGGTMLTTPVDSVPVGNVSGPLPEDVSDLQPETTYVFRVCGKDTPDTSFTCANFEAFTTNPANLAGNVYTERPAIIGSSATDPGQFQSMMNDRGPYIFPGDGIFSLRLPNGTTLWAFGDGSVQNHDGGRKMVTNSLVVQDGPLLSAVVGGTKLDPKATVSQGNDSFYPGQPFLDGGKVRQPLGRHVDGQHVATVLATFDPDSLELEGVTTVSNSDEIAWGESVVQDDNYTYFYGQTVAGGPTYVARAPLGQPQGPWEFRAGSGWSAQEANATPILNEPLSNVVRTPNGFTEIWHVFGVVNMRRGPNPWTFGDQQQIATTPSPEGCNHFPYLAKLHPEFNAGGKVLMSYFDGFSQTCPNESRFVALDAATLGF
jgi:hypothetical protein